MINLSLNSNDVHFSFRFVQDLTKAEQVVKRVATYKGNKVELPEVKVTDFTLDGFTKMMQSLMPFEAKMVKSMPKAAKAKQISEPQISSETTSERGKAKVADLRPLPETNVSTETEFEEKIHNFKDSDFQMVGFYGDITSYSGRLIGQGKKPDFRNRQEGNKPAIRPAIDLQLEDGSPVRIFGASLPACVEAAKAKSGDFIEVRLTKRGTAGKAHQYFIKKLN